MLVFKLATLLEMSVAYFKADSEYSCKVVTVLLIAPAAELAADETALAAELATEDVVADMLCIISVIFAKNLSKAPPPSKLFKYFATCFP